MTEEQQREAALRRMLASEEQARIQVLGELVTELGDMGAYDLKLLRTMKRIIDREVGSTTPVENFLTQLILRYQINDERGEGLTREDVERELDDELKPNYLPGALKTAYFLTDRYPRPEAEVENA